MIDFDKSTVKILAFYLPQFHPIPENDAWWGKGFTEWTNVVSARPRFSGHNQPHLPGDLGFYDLRLLETRIAQAELAQKYGVYGFCYYHYWFNGKLLLDAPLKSVLSSSKPDIPFCICWANENWTRAWDGLDRQVLIKQEYSCQDSLRHIEHLIPIITDMRYIRVNNKPLILIYRPDIIPNLSALLSLWRKVAQHSCPSGIYLAGVMNNFSGMTEQQYLEAGFDAVIDFQPNRSDFPKPKALKSKIKNILQYYLPDRVYQKIKLSITANNIVNYQEMVLNIQNKKWPIEYTKFPCVFPSWDNSARRKSATIIQNADYNLFSQWLITSIQNVKKYNIQEQLVFINAWNEWAEGCHLEPDKVNGHGFLKAVLDAIQANSSINL